MGLSDEIRWDAALPEGHSPDSRLFQTKSLDYASWDYYVVTREGRLVLVGNGWEDDTDLSMETEISHGIDVEFHGDMRLCSRDGPCEYLARFTHGSLEWIRPLADDEPWTTVGAAHLKYLQARPRAKIEQPERGGRIPEDHLDEHMAKLKTE